MLKRALASLLRSSDGAGVLVVGGALTLLAWTVTPLWLGGVLLFPPLLVLAPLALAPALVVRGYFVRVLTDAVETGNAAGAPPFVAWNRLYRDGVKSALLSAVLLAPLALLFGLVAVGAFVVGSGRVDPSPALDPITSALNGPGIAALGGLGAGVVAVTVGVYLVAVAYLRPAALAAFAATGRLRDGLRPRRVARVAGSGGYATAWVVATVTLLAGYVLAGPLVALVVGVPLVFATRVVAHALYGRGAAPVMETPEGPSADTDTGDVVDEALDDGTVATTPVDDAPRRPTEPPVAVQIGRPVPFGGDIGRLVERDGGTSTDDGEFDWTTTIESPADELGGVAQTDSGETDPDSGETDPDSGETDPDSGGERGTPSDGTGAVTDATAFDWGPDGDGDKDKR